MQQPLIEMLVWMRVPGDSIFSVGAVTLAVFVARLWILPKKAVDKLPGGTEPSGRA